MDIKVDFAAKINFAYARYGVNRSYLLFHKLNDARKVRNSNRLIMKFYLQNLHMNIGNTVFDSFVSNVPYVFF